MSEHETGYGKPPKETQFKPGKSGNPRGRPRKRDRHALPRQMREDVIRLSEELFIANTPKGRKKLSGNELVLRAILLGAVNGNPTAMKKWIELYTWAVRDRLKSNPPVQFADSMLQQKSLKTAAMHKIGIDPEFDLLESIKEVF